MLNWNDINRSFAELDAFRRQWDRAFERTLRNEGRRGGLSQLEVDSGATLTAEGDRFLLRADLPGVDPADIDLQVTTDGITLRARRTVGVPEGYTTHRRERGGWEFSRSWSLPAPVNVDETRAEVVHGVLTVTMPKAADAQPRRITVKA